MSTDDQNKDDKLPKGDEETAPARDARGRWLPGHCPNRQGRPRKKLIGDIDQADIQHFKNTLVEVMTHEGPTMMTREQALLTKMYEDAMKGKFAQQRFLKQEFEKNAERLAMLRIDYDRLIHHWILDNPNYGKPGFEMPAEVANEMVALRSILHHYYPSDYPEASTNFVMRSDEGDDEEDDEAEGNSGET